ncbi:aminopeptidase B-like isoform X1 [Branchiostoma lanceolatum]|uniref:aminopeptidase B-like isoform X1 n=1 Tax=Branchiostoma lanceolatum TaxID=7740 RepID=UPI0034554217
MADVDAKRPKLQFAGSSEKLYSDSAEDVASAANFRQVKVNNYHLDLDVEFKTKKIRASAVLDLECLQPCAEVILDSHATLTIHGVRVTYKDDRNTSDQRPVTFDTRPFTSYGAALHVSLPSAVKPGDEFQLEFSYTAGEGPAMCWLEPMQTAGKKQPYLFTIGQSVLNRSMFPCIDTPAIKSTYTAQVKVPAGLTAVMSASSRMEGPEPNTTHFTMEHPIPAYLIALAVGDIASADIGPRSKVWTEPSVLDKAKAEFEGVVEEYIKVAEGLFGPYVWGQYDILVMPPSFPYGGMENPCLTFVTPCLLVGDKSLTDVVMHELCHSWFGNLVTNANWSEFWLNEGFTMFSQRRVCATVLGEPYKCLEAATGQALLQNHITTVGENHPLNCLRVKIEKGVDPDDTYNETPYEKGCAFVSYLQHCAGGDEKFDQFLKAYISKFKYRSVVAEDMLEFYLDYFPHLREQDLRNKPGYEFERWLNTPGWPPFVADLSPGQQLTRPAEQLAAHWAGEKNLEVVPDISEWKTYQIVHFLDKLVERPKLTHDTIQTLAQAYPHIAQSHNAELIMRWCMLIIKSNFTSDLPKVRAFLESQGKQKYTLPIYRALKAGSPEAQDFAREVFAATKDTLHVNVYSNVEKILGA